MGHGVKMVIEFDQRLEALNLKITSPLDTTVFKNIRLPFWLRQIFPLHHSTNLVEQVYRALFGERLFGKCILDRGHVHTFDKRTYNYHLDDCYHLVAADCTKRNTHAILAKEKDNVKHVMIFFENHKIVIEEPALRYPRPTTAFTVKMQTGQERMVVVEVVPDRLVRLLGGLVTVRWSSGILTVDTPAHRVIYNGKVLDVMDKAILAAGRHQVLHPLPLRGSPGRRPCAPYPVALSRSATSPPSPRPRCSGTLCSTAQARSASPRRCCLSAPSDSWPSRPW